MADILPFQSGATNSSPQSADGRIDPEGNLAKFIALAKRSPALKGVVWESLTWRFDADDPVAKKTNSHRAYSNELMFSNRETSKKGWSRVRMEERQPMAQPFLDFARSFVRLHAESSSPNITILRKDLAILSILEALLKTTGAADPTLLTIGHFKDAEAMLKTDYAARTAYKMSNMLENVAEQIDRHKITATPIRYRTGIKRPNDGDELTEGGQTEGAEKMISEDALRALADIYRSPADEVEKLIGDVCAILVASGFRIGELLALPVDCWFEDEGRCGIRHGTKKVREMGIKWLPSASAPVAKQAIADLTVLCREAREVAKWMRMNPGRIRELAHLDPGSEIRILDAIALLGGNDGTTYFIASNGIKATSTMQGLVAKVGEIECALCARFAPFDVALTTMKSGAEIRLDEALIVVFENQLHMTRGTLKWLPRPLTQVMLVKHLELILARRAGAGQDPIKIKTHGPRHWLNTLASNEGVGELDLALWSGRKDIAQNDAYKHLKLTKRTALARELILDGKMEGSVARIANSIPDPIERKNYVDARVQAAHTTPYGVCLHPYAAAPCMKHLQCLSDRTGKGCSELAREKGNKRERDELLRLKSETEDNLAKAREAMEQDVYNASNWVLAQQKTLDGIISALAVDDLPGVKEGVAVRVFPNGKSHFTSS